MKYHKDYWDFSLIESRPASAPSALKLNIGLAVPPSCDFDARFRRELLEVFKDWCYWQNTTKGKSWFAIITKSPSLFSPLSKLMAEKNYVAISEVSLSDLKKFTMSPEIPSDQRSRRIAMLSELYQLRLAGITSDGPSVDAKVVSKRRTPIKQSGRSTKARPFQDDIYLTGLAAAVRHIGAFKADLIKELNDLRGTEIKPVCRLKKNLGNTPSTDAFWIRIREFQTACYIVIASTLIGRVNEFQELLRGCCHSEEIDGEIAIVIDLIASKKRGARPLEKSLGISLTADAIAALEDLNFAYIRTRGSKFLFATFGQFRSTDQAVGAPILYGPIKNGVRKFISRYVELSKLDSKGINLHRYRATSMMNLCRERNGVLATQRQARMTSIATVKKYVSPEVGTTAITTHLNRVTPSGF